MRTIDEGTDSIELNIAVEKVGFIIIKAREFDVKVDPVEPQPGSNASDDGESSILSDYAGDATEEELRGAISSLDEEEVIDLIAMVWIGRGDFDASKLDEARALADERHKRNSADYLLGIPLLGDYLEEGLSALGYSYEDVEKSHL
jgi:hypothetical protein